MKKISLEIQELAEQFQEECHEQNKEIIKRLDTCTTQDATNVWLFIKLAELQLRIQTLENPNPLPDEIITDSFN